MTLSTTTNRVSYTGNGVTTAFSFPYYFLANADLTVILVTIATGAESTLVLNTDYTVTGAGNPAGGTVTTTSAYSSSYNVVIYRNPALTQSADFVENQALPAATLEQGLDRATMIDQRTRELASRSVRQPEGDTADIDYLPPKVTRASKYFAFDADGDPVASSGTTSSVVISTFAETVVDDTSASAMRTTIGAAGLTGNETIAGDKTLSGSTTLSGAVTLSSTITPSGAGAVTYDPAADTLLIVDASDSNRMKKAAGTEVGKLVARAKASYATQTSSTATIPTDTSIPQSGEGTEILTLAVTPKSASNIIRLRFTGQFGGNATGFGVIALFKDSGADALAVGSVFTAATMLAPGVLEYEETAGSTSARTYKIRVGPDTGTLGTLYINRSSSVALYGGAMLSCVLIAEEISP